MGEPPVHPQCPERVPSGQTRSDPWLVLRNWDGWMGRRGWCAGEPLLHQANCALLALALPRVLDAAACVSSAASERMTPHHSGYSHILANVRQALSAGRAPRTIVETETASSGQQPGCSTARR